MAAMLAQQLEQQIQEEVDAQIANDRQNVIHAEPMNSGSSLAKPNGGNDESSKVCGIPRQMFPFVVVILLVIVGGIIGGVVAMTKLDNDSSETANAKSSPPVNQEAAPVNIETLRQELEQWIVRQEEDRLRFDDPSSPQSLALEWLAADLGNPDTYSATEKLERYVLAVLYYSTNGENWQRQDFPVLSEGGACSWNNGLQPLQDDNSIGFFCRGSTIVDFINLRTNGLTGTLPWELGLLSNLLYLHMQENALTGTIPTELGGLSNLVSMMLSSNFLTGPLPPDLASTLRVLELSGNSLTGTIPSVWGQNLASLMVLSVDSNDLSGPLPSEIGQLTTLKHLLMLENSLTGTVPSEYGQLSELIQILIGPSSVSGPLSTELGRLTNLLDFIVYESSLTGTIPTEFGQWTSLERMVIAGNELTGTVPTQLTALKNLAGFVFSGNNLIGSVDDIFCTTSNNTPSSLILQADCLVNATTGQSEIECTCCIVCCSAYGDQCTET